jgi:hypothetical protein
MGQPVVQAVSCAGSGPTGASSIPCAGDATGRSSSAPTSPAAAKTAPARNAAWYQRDWAREEPVADVVEIVLTERLLKT